MSYNGQFRVGWSPNGESDLAGYKLYVGGTSHVYDGFRTITTTGILQVVTGLDNGLPWYAAVTAYDQTGNESIFSVEVSKVVTVSVLQLLRRVA